MIYETPGFQYHSITNINRRCPIDVLPGYNVFDVTFEGPMSNYQPASLDSAPPPGRGIDGLLVSQGELINIDGGQFQYTRSYADVPPAHSYRESYAYTFPGLSFLQGPDNPASRPPITRKVSSRVSFEYMRVSGSPSAGGSLQPGGGIDTFPLQPLPVFRVVWTGSETESPVAWGVGTAYSTTPTAEGYFNLVGNEIVTESDVVLWMGNIYCRITRYVIAV